MACKDCLNRREFLASAAAAAALVALEGCGDGQIGPSAPGSGTVIPAGGLTINIADYPALSATGQLVRVRDRNIGVVRTGATTFVASNTECTHEGCDTNVRNNRYECPCHDSMFTATGDLIRGPATRALDRIPTTFNAASGELKIG